MTISDSKSHFHENPGARNALPGALQLALTGCAPNPYERGGNPQGLSRLRKNHFGTEGLRCLTRFGQEETTLAGCSKRPSSKAAASEGARRTLRYVEPLSAARTPLADFFSILLRPEQPARAAHEISSINAMRDTCLAAKGYTAEQASSYCTAARR